MPDRDKSYGIAAIKESLFGADESLSRELNGKWKNS